MILADKIIQLRKKNGWSQEELAEKMNVSRQAVSKWEAAQTTPNLEKVLQLGNLFGVTTDYLLKDEMEDEEFTDSMGDVPIKKISLADANLYLSQREKASIRIAIATFLCITSILPLLILLAFHILTPVVVPEKIAVGVGIIFMCLMVAMAVLIFVSVGFKNSPYEFLENVPFETEYGVSGFVIEKQKEFRNTYVKYNCIGIFLCILSVLPILCVIFKEDEFYMLMLLCATILIVGIGVIFLIIAGVRWASTQKLLKEGDFSEIGKRRNKIIDTISLTYWLIATTGYLGWSFVTGDWGITWIVWPIAAVLFVAVAIISNLIFGLDKN